jgi:hypothetical protein
MIDRMSMNYRVGLGPHLRRGTSSSMKITSHVLLDRRELVWVSWGFAM